MNAQLIDGNIVAAALRVAVAAQVQRRHAPIARHGHPGQAYRTSLALAEWLCGTADRIDPA